MCFDAKNNPISGVRNSDFGYDVTLQDGTMGNVTNSPGAQGYDEVQSYLAKSAPTSSADGPKSGSPNAGGLSLSQIGGSGKGGAEHGVRSISQVNDGGGRYGIGTAQSVDAEGTTRTMDQAPPTPGNIAQTIGNVLGFPSSALTMGLTQGHSLAGGPIAGVVDGMMGSSKTVGSPKSASAVSPAQRRQEAGGVQRDVRNTKGGDRGAAGTPAAGTGPKGKSTDKRPSGADGGGAGRGNKGGGVSGGGGGQRSSDGGRTRY